MKFTQRGSIAIEISYNEANQLLKVAIKDTGLGIKAED